MSRAMVMGVVNGRRDPWVGRMVGLSAALHGSLLFLLIVVVPLLTPREPPITAYTVELTDSSSLGGRLAPGRPDLPMGPRGGTPGSGQAPAKLGEPAPKPPEPVAKTEPPPPEPVAPVKPEPPKPPPAKPVEAKAPEPPKPIEPAVKLPSLEKPPVPKPEPKVEPKQQVQKPPEPKPQPKPEAKPEPAKPEPKATADAKKPEPSAKTADATKPADAKATARPTDPKPDAKPAGDAKPSAEAKPAGKPNGKSDGEPDGNDAYAAAAEKWRAKGATGGGGGLGGTDTGDGPIGTPGYGGGGGGQVVGFVFLAYQQRVVQTVKSGWTNAAVKAGLVAKVRFQIAPDGNVTGVRLEHPSGDTSFDGSVVRAVQRANPLPPPPARYANEFRDFIIEFHSEEEGGRASG
jgi:TolA protein